MTDNQEEDLAGPGGMTRQLRVARVGFWMTIVALGALERGVLGTLAALYGVDRLAHAVSGRSVTERLLASLRNTGDDAGRRRFGEGTRDLVEEASWESFPASDPPGRGIG